MSIRLWSDGHSFPELPNAEAPLTVELLGRKTTLVPAEAFAPEQAAAMLEWCGLQCSRTERAVWSEAQEGKVAVMAIDENTLARLPHEVRFTSPLLRLGPQAQSLALERHGNLLYIKLWRSEGLTLAEVVRIDGEADVLYFLAELSRICPLKPLTLRLVGKEAAELRSNRLLKSQFKRIVCE